MSGTLLIDGNGWDPPALPLLVTVGRPQHQHGLNFDAAGHASRKRARSRHRITVPARNRLVQVTLTKSAASLALRFLGGIGLPWLHAGEVDHTLQGLLFWRPERIEVSLSGKTA
jgi:hypothetical protein